jgi:cysteinyl-tRNA synthetase
VLACSDPFLFPKRKWYVIPKKRDNEVISFPRRDQAESELARFNSGNQLIKFKPWFQRRLMLRLFNTMTRKKEIVAKKNIGFYFCGPTVYDYAHIGNFRAYVFSDILRRYLEYKGFRVKFVMNITDVDDKTIKNSQKEGITLQEFTKKYEKAFFEDMEKLRIKRADVHPRATEHIDEMAKLIKNLIEKGIAYKGNDGSIYYSIKKFKDYGKLSKLKIRKLKSGARVRQDEYTKEQAQDFALWKAWQEDDGNVYWNVSFDSEAIKGRPGWHIECSAMARKHLNNVDIHGGGVDLIFPHHENEIAQSEGVKKGFVKYWVHCEHLLVDGKKMSKSLGNFHTLRDLLEKDYDPLAIRFLLASAHYRKQLNFTFASVEDAKNTINALNDFLGKIKFLEKETKATENKQLAKKIADSRKKFEKYMDDDLNAPQALASVFAMINDVNKSIEKKKIDKKSLKEAEKFLKDVNRVFDFASEDEEITQEERELIMEREELRKQKNFAEADKIRNILKEKGIILEDTPQGIRWRKIRK